jgi:hypothetical protein
MDTKHDTSSRFVAGVEARAGGNLPGGMETAIRTTIRALGGQLTHTPSTVAEALGDDLAAEIEQGRKLPAVAPDDLVTIVARRTQVRPAVALEVIESVVAELSARIGPVARDDLRRTLAPAWGAMIVDPRPASADVHAPARPRQAAAGRTLAAAEPNGNTLATGKPGSKHAVADSD